MSIALAAVFTAFTAYLGYKKYWSRKLFALLLSASLICLAAACVREVFYERVSVESIPRNAAGDGDSTVNLKVIADNEELDINLEVPSMEYTSDEAVKLLRLARARIEKLLPEDRAVDEDIDLPVSYDDLGVSITWYSSDYAVMDGSGKIGSGVSSEGSEVTLKALLKAGSYESEITRTVTVFPSDDLSLAEKISAEAESLNEGSENGDYLLPDEVDGTQLVWYMPDTDNIFVAAFLILLLGIFLHTREKEKEKNEIEEKKAALKREYPEFVSTLLMFMYAGLACRSAFKRMAAMYSEKDEGGTGRGSISLKEAAAACAEMERGVSEREAYSRMGERCSLPSYRTLAMLLGQNLKHGSAGLIARLEQETLLAYEERISAAKAEGEKISVKLILPMGMMLVTVLIILIFPAMTSVG